MSEIPSDEAIAAAVAQVRAAVPIEVPIAFQDWIAITAEQGMGGVQQFGLWLGANPNLTVEAVRRARCLAGFHDDHEPGDSQWCAP